MWSVLVIAALGVGPASASEELTLRWEAPEPCPGQPAVREQIERLLVDTPRPRPELDVTAKVTGTDGGYALALQIVQGGTVGQREVEAATCDELAEATALLVAIAVDPSLATVPEPEPVDPSGPAGAGTSGPEPVDPSGPAGAGTSGPEPVDPSGPAGAGTSGPEPEPEPAPEAGRGWRGVGFVRGGAAVALVPGWSGFLQAGGGVGWRRVEVHGLASGWLPRTASAGDVTGRVQAWTGGVQGCPVLRPTRRISVPLCVGLHAGAMLGRGLGGLDGGRRRATQPWVAASLDPGVRVRVQRWVSLRAGAHLFVSLVRPAFDTEQGTLVHRADPVGGAFTAGIVVGQPPG